MKIVVSYRGIPQARGYAFGACLARAYRRLGHEVFEYGHYYQATEALSSSAVPSQADALIYCECNDLDAQYEELQSFDAPIKAYWDFDIDNHPGRTLNFVKKMRFTHVFFANKRYGPLLSCLCSKTHYLPIGFDDELFRPMPEIVKSLDIGLCGTVYPNRVALIEMLRENSIEAKLITHVYGGEYVEAINSFRIHLNYGVGGGRGLLPARIWETLGCQTLLMAEKSDFIDLFLHDMQEAVLYSTPEECIAKIRMLLQKPALIEKIAVQGYEIALSNHSYLRRAEAMLTAFTVPDPKKQTSVAAWLCTHFLVCRYRLVEKLHSIKAYWKSCRC